MATEGFIGFYVETRNYGATAAFWKSLGFENVFEGGTSGQWVHPKGGPYVFIEEQQGGPLATHPILLVTDSAAFKPDPTPTYEEQFTAQHWDMMQALIKDPDGRIVSLQAPLPG